MFKVLWLTNFPMPNISKKEGLPLIVNEGWITGLSAELIKNKNIELVCIFPQSKFKKGIVGKLDGLKYYGFYQSRRQNFHSIYNQLSTIVMKESPKIIHIFGTEFYHAYVMAQVATDEEFKNKMIVSIQGLISICSNHYYAGLANKVIKSYTLRDFLRHDNIKLARSKFIARGNNELELLRKAKHIIGRTEFDYACTKLINDNMEYHFCGEILRKTFYDNKWNIEKCKKRSIFLSQGNYPLKGLHFVIEALINIKKKYDDVILYIGGSNIIKDDTILDKLKITSYGKYIKSLIQKNKLENNIIFLGRLNEREICQKYLESNVVVSASSIENSSNSIGEAMLLGAPIVASYVGGTNSIVTHEVEALLYPYDAPYFLTHYISKIFDDDNLAINLSINARIRALNQYDRNKIINQLVQIYNKVQQ